MRDIRQGRPLGSRISHPIDVTAMKLDLKRGICKFLFSTKEHTFGLHEI